VRKIAPITVSAALAAVLLGLYFYWSASTGRSENTTLVSQHVPRATANEVSGSAGSIASRTAPFEHGNANRKFEPPSSYSSSPSTLRWLRVQQTRKLGESISTLAQSGDVMDQIMAVRLASLCVVVPASGEDIRQSPQILGRLGEANTASQAMVESAVNAGQELQRQCARSSNEQLDLVEAMMKNSSTYADSLAQNIGRIKGTKNYGELSATEVRAVDTFLANAESNLPLLQIYGSRLLAGPLRSDAWESLQSAQERSAAVELVACSMGNDCRSGSLSSLYLCYTELICSASSVEDALRGKLAISAGSWDRVVNVSSEIANALRRNNRPFFSGLRP